LNFRKKNNSQIQRIQELENMEDGERKTTNGISEELLKEKIQELAKEEISR